MGTSVIKPKHRFWKRILFVIGFIIIIFAVYFILQVLAIRKQILSGDYNWQKYGQEISGAGGANISTARFSVESSDDPAIGAPADKAKVTIVEFGDFACSHTGRAFPIIRSVAANYEKSVRLIYRDFPLLGDHPQAKLAAQAGYCANEQQKFWQFHDKAFNNQENLARDELFTLANQIGLNESSFRECLDSPRAAAEVMDDLAAGVSAGVAGTPTWFINGMRVAGVIPEEVLKQVIEEMIKE